MFNFATAGLCAVFLVLWSSGWIGLKFAAGQMGPFTFLTWRYLLVVVLLAGFVVLSRQWRCLSYREFVHHLNVGFLSHGVFLGAAVGAFQLGASAGTVAFVTATQPLVTAAITSVVAVIGTSRFIDKTPGRTQWIGIGLGLAAVVVVIGSQISLGGSAMAYVLLLASLLALSLATLIDRSVTLKICGTKKTPAPLPQVLLLHSLAALAMFVCFAGFLEGYVAQWDSRLVAALVYMSVVVSIGSYGLMFFLLRRTSVMKVSSLAYLTPPTTMLMAWFIFGETVSVDQWAGLVLATVAVALIYLGDITRNSGTGNSINRNRTVQTRRPADVRY